MACQRNIFFRRNWVLTSWDPWLEKVSTVWAHLGQLEYSVSIGETVQYAHAILGAAVTTSHGLNQTSNG